MAVLGATGSIGTATVDVINHLNVVDPQNRWCMRSASGHRNLNCLTQMAQSVQDAPAHLILSDAQAAADYCPPPELANAKVSVGAEALVEAAIDPAIDIVVAAIVGRAGLESTLAAFEHGKRVALANKETLVVAGPLVRERIEKSGAEMLPVDSEHSAIFQCMGTCSSKPKRLILTASGGPFRTWSTDQMDAATPESALAHPTWEMGPKITIDSATMMNKSLEVIEARWLFDLPADKIEVVVHPQSIIHSMVEFEDGSVIAQLSPPDMRLPIQYALTYPRRLPCQSPPLDRTQTWDLSLEPVDRERFPALDLGFEVARVGGTAGSVVNAANEQAVGLFLNGEIRFTDIVQTCRRVLENHSYQSDPSLETLLELDRWARKETLRCCGQIA
ncbi:1-deoxy-D-xylulose-5-phosphate reductoisomerase [Planctomycetes bacterium K23_9]|uniref:1-deoxy-D-xylulose-5-phosphate reductoisomerase n=1 Tax=Stieleria marina TaxID=1930275 RepID=UPI00119DA68C